MTRLKITASIAAISLAAIAHPVFAQANPRPPEPTPAPAPSGPDQRPGLERPTSGQYFDLYRQTETDPEIQSERYANLVSFAQCAFKRSPGAIMDILATESGSSAEERKMRFMLRRYKGCGSSVIEAKPLSIRGAAAEAALQLGGDYALSPIASVNLSGVSPDVVRGPVTADMEQFVQCQVLLAPREAVRYLRSGVGSKDEVAARKNLFGAAPQCGDSDSLLPYLEPVHRAYTALVLQSRLAGAGVLFARAD